MPPVKHWPQSVSTQSTVPSPTSAPGLVRLTFSMPSVAARSRSMSRYWAERAAGIGVVVDQLVDGAVGCGVAVADEQRRLLAHERRGKEDREARADLDDRRKERERVGRED